MRHANRPSARVSNLDHIARLRVASISHITRKNPRVSTLSAVDSFAIYANSGQPAFSHEKEKRADF